MMGEMSPAGRGDAAGASGEQRASHNDRDRVVELLRDAAGDGRLTADELDQRLEQALTARTHGELTALTRDLTAAEPKDLIRIDCRSGSTKRDGRWLVPRRIEVKVTSGTVKLDFTEAVITQPSLQIDAEVRSGSLILLTKPGVVVDVDDVTVRSGSVRVNAPWNPDTPAVLRIHVAGKVGSGSIKARPPGRTFWQWLRRRPRPYTAARR